MHLDLDRRFGLVYMINTMRKKNAFPSVNNTSYIIVHTLEHHIQWNVRISFQSKTYFLDFHSPSFKKKKKERALILSLFIQGNKEDRIFLLFHPVLSTDKSIRAKEPAKLSKYPFTSPLFRSCHCAVSIPLSLPTPSRINSKVIRARSSSNKMHRDELASIREELIVCTEANYSEALKFKSISYGSWERGREGRTV